MSELRWQDEIWKRLAVYLSRRSEATSKSYLSSLEDLLRFLSAEIGTDAGAQALARLDEAAAEEYAAALSRRPGQPSRVTGRVRVAASTVKFRLARLRTIFRELLRSRLVAQNPFERLADEVRAERGTKRPTEAIAAEDVVRLLDLPDRTTWKGRRDRCLLALLFGGGLRLQEALQLRLSDVKKGRVGSGIGPTIRVAKAKGTAVPSLVALPAWTAESVLGWLDERVVHGGTDDDVLLAGHRGAVYNRALSPKTAWRAFRRYARIAGLEHKSPHSARASFATYLDSLNIPVGDIALAMRHRDRRTTETYIKRANPAEKSASLKATYDTKKNKRAQK